MVPTSALLRQPDAAYINIFSFLDRVENVDASSWIYVSRFSGTCKTAKNIVDYLKKHIPLFIPDFGMGFERFIKDIERKLKKGQIVYIRPLHYHEAATLGLLAKNYVHRLELTNVQAERFLLNTDPRFLEKDLLMKLMTMPAAPVVLKYYIKQDDGKDPRSRLDPNQKREFVLAAAKANPGLGIIILNDLGYSDDREVVERLVSHSGSQLEHASANLRGDDKIVRIALSQDPLSLQYTDWRYQNNDTLVENLVHRDLRVLDILPAKYKSSESLARIVLSIDGLRLGYFNHEIRGNHEIAQLALDNNPKAFIHLTDDLKNDFDFVKANLAKNPWTLQGIGETLKKSAQFRILVLFGINTHGPEPYLYFCPHDAEIMLAMVKFNFQYLHHASHRLQADPKFLKDAVEQNPLVLGEIPEPQFTKEIVLAALENFDERWEKLSEAQKRHTFFLPKMGLAVYRFAPDKLDWFLKRMDPIAKELLQDDLRRLTARTAPVPEKKAGKLESPPFAPVQEKKAGLIEDPDSEDDQDVEDREEPPAPENISYFQSCLQCFSGIFYSICGSIRLLTSSICSYFYRG